MAQNYSKYKLYRKYKTEDGVNYTPLDEYQAMYLSGNNTDCECGYRVYEYVETDEYVCGCEITENDIVEGTPDSNSLLIPYKKYIEYESCPTDESYNQQTDRFKYVVGGTPSQDCFNCANLIFEWTGSRTSLSESYVIQNPSYSITTSPYGIYCDPPTGNNDGTTLPTSITKLIKHPDTSRYTTMNRMFRYCSLLTDVNLSNFNTSNVTDMTYMFSGCTSLTSLDLSSFNASKVTTMQGMFYDCSSLTSITFGDSFNASNVNVMTNMFYRCSNLKSLDLSSFNTSQVTSMGSMFYGCYKLTSLDLSGWDTSNVTGMTDTFERCSGLTSITINNVNCNTIQDIGDMIRKSDYTLGVQYINMITNVNCWENEVPISFKISNVVNNTFYFKFNNVTYYFKPNTDKYFTNNGDGTYNFNITLKDIWEIDLTSVNYNTDGGYFKLLEINSLPVTEATSYITFKQHPYLSSINTEGWNTSNITDMSYMFEDCSGLTSLDLTSFDTSKVTNMYCMFYTCRSLTSLDLSGWDMSKVTNTSSMFYNCKSLKTVKVSGCSTTTINKLVNTLKISLGNITLNGDIINID